MGTSAYDVSADHNANLNKSYLLAHGPYLYPIFFMTLGQSY